MGRRCSTRRHRARREIVAAIRAIAPAFGGINLEDISAPRCFAIERRLRDELDIPVFHDDQHGTAVVVLAALLNGLRVVGKRPDDLEVVVTGIGAAGVATSKILLAAGVENVIGVDRHGALWRGDPALSGTQSRVRGGDEPPRREGERG
jgi:malate dehydrogenase (oxaloacetate-decarboxylating)